MRVAEGIVAHVVDRVGGVLRQQTAHVVLRQTRVPRHGDDQGRGPQPGPMTPVPVASDGCEELADTRNDDAADRCADDETQGNEGGTAPAVSTGNRSVT